MAGPSKGAGAVPTVEFSRPFDLNRLGDEEVVQEISATAAERAALIERFGLLSLDRLEARLSVRRQRRGNLVRLEGRLSAAGAQACVVTLEPVAYEIDSAFAQDFTTDPAAAEEELEADPEEADVLEAIGPEGLDLGEIVAQQFAVALDPYPRARGAALAQTDWGEDDAEEAEEKANPFAVLRDLQKPH